MSETRLTTKLKTTLHEAIKCERVAWASSPADWYSLICSMRERGGETMLNERVAREWSGGANGHENGRRETSVTEQAIVASNIRWIRVYVVLLRLWGYFHHGLVDRRCLCNGLARQRCSSRSRLQVTGIWLTCRRVAAIRNDRHL